jgi:hypothetical protein
MRNWKQIHFRTLTVIVGVLFVTEIITNIFGYNPPNLFMEIVVYSLFPIVSGALMAPWVFGYGRFEIRYYILVNSTNAFGRKGIIECFNISKKIKRDIAFDRYFEERTGGDKSGYEILEITRKECEELVKIFPSGDIRFEEDNPIGKRFIH